MGGPLGTPCSSASQELDATLGAQGPSMGFGVLPLGLWMDNIEMLGSPDPEVLCCRCWLVGVCETTRGFPFGCDEENAPWGNGVERGDEDAKLC